MALARAERGFRLACTALVAGMIAAGGMQAAWGIDCAGLLPDFSICLAHWLSDLPCPGCGMLRALLRLGQLRIGDAMGLHPLSIPCALGAAWVAVGSPGRGRLRALPAPVSGWALGSAIALVLAVWALRISDGTTL